VALDALIENAVDHTDPDGRIELSARLQGEEIVLSVKDSGSGIPAADLGHVFDRFTRVGTGRSRETGGFGLGLAVVKAIAQAHQGSVQVRSTVGRGSVFDLSIPAAAAGPALEPPSPQDLRATPTRNHNVPGSSGTSAGESGRHCGT